MEKYSELVLSLIPKGIMKEYKGSHKDTEDKKLELRLGPPAVDQPLLSACYMATETTLKNITSHGAKRGFQETIGAKLGERNWKGKLSFTEKPVCTYPRSSGPFSPFPSSSAYHQEQSQKQSPLPKPSLLLSSLISKSAFAAKTEESTQPCNSREVELKCPEEKLCSPTVFSSNTTANNSTQKRNTLGPVVGWPPIRSYRKNIAASNSSKLAPESSNEIPREGSGKKTENLENSFFVKINMDGVPIGRKIDLKAYDNYEKLSSAVDELFRGLLKAQRSSSPALIEDESGEKQDIMGALDGSGLYTLVYEDNEGDRMLVGDVPWHMFVSSAKRLRVLKKSELPTLHLSSSKLEKTSLNTAT